MKQYHECALNVLFFSFFFFFFVYWRELGPGAVSLTGDWTQATDSKQYAFSNQFVFYHTD